MAEAVEDDRLSLLSRSTSEDDYSLPDVRRRAASDADNMFAALVGSIKSKIFGEGTYLSLVTSTLIMVSLSYGSAVVILPYTMSQLGPVTWTIYTALIIAILAFCTVLLKHCCVYVMETEKDYAMIRHPYSTIAKIAVGERFGKVVQAILYVCLVSMTLAFVLLGATILDNLIPIPLSYDNQIRVWLFALFVVSTPLMFVGTYNDLEMPAIIAVISSTISMVSIMIICLIARFYYGMETDNFLRKEEIHENNFFIVFGEITFAAAGPAIALPNVIVFIKKPEKFHYSIIASHFVVFLIYIACAVSAYAVFGRAVTPSITGTLSSFLKSIGNSSNASSALLVISQVSMCVHFMLVAVLSINPVFLSLENTFRVPVEFSMKRVFVRGSVWLAMLIFCVIIPYFSPVLSMVGAVPQTIMTIVFPTIIYWNLFETSLYMKIVIVVLNVSAGVLIVGNTVFSMINLVDMLSK